MARLGMPQLLGRIARDAALRRKEEVQKRVRGWRARLIVDPDGELKREVERLVVTVIIKRFEGSEVPKPL